ncbi:MAG: leucine-rich repeat protein [Firmicutes bacterium]|nr:leucine-rich repeat protein [Bacillota bacterium]
MENKSFIKKNGMKVLFISLIVMLFCVVTIGIVGTQSTIQVYSNTLSSSNVSNQRNDYTLDELQEIMRSGEQLYQGLRVQSDTQGTATYQVPVQPDEIEYVMEIQSSGTYRANRNSSGSRATGYPITQIRNSGLPHANSIVIILMGDAFTANQYGSWPNPVAGTVLAHANNAVNALTNTHPFSQFAHLITVFVIHVESAIAGINGHLGTVDASGNHTSVGINQTHIRQLADAVVPRSEQTMLQVISNAKSGTGYSLTNWHEQLIVNIASTSIRRDANPAGGSNSAWPNGTAWHGTIIHEFGHSFGILADEHDDRDENGKVIATRDNRRANSTDAADANVKWNHWGGYDNVLATPTRFADGWAVPALVSDTSGDSGCIMRASWGNRYFCGVCAEELMRRMGIVTGYMPDVNALDFAVISRSIGIIGFRTYTVRLINTNPFAAMVTYNSRMAFGNHARDFTSLDHLTHITVPANGITNVGIQENIGATHITMSLRFVIGPTEFRMITYADGLTPNSSNPPQYNVLNLGVGFNAVNLTATTAEITGARATPVGKIYVPYRINNRDVTAIAPSAFANQTSLTHISIPATVTSVGTNAFANTAIWNNAANNSMVYAGNWVVGVKGQISGAVGLVNNTRGIGDSAFANQTSRFPINIPSTVTSIGDGNLIRATDNGEVSTMAGGAPVRVSAWDNVPTAPYINVTRAFVDNLPRFPLDGTTVHDHFGHVFIFAGGAPIHVDNWANIGGSRPFIRVDGVALRTHTETGPFKHVRAHPADGTVVRVLNGSAFSFLGGVALPLNGGAPNATLVDFASIPHFTVSQLSLNLRTASITGITNLPSVPVAPLSEVSIPSAINLSGQAHTVTEIGISAFANQTSLTQITIPSSVESIGTLAFDRAGLHTVHFEGNSKLKSIGTAAFQDASALSLITIPASVESIGTYAFLRNTSLQHVTFENGSKLSTIEYGAFANCSQLTQINIPNSVTSIGLGAFSGCTALTSITVPFVGQARDAASNWHFGYIFGSISHNYFVPSSLKSITVTDGTIFKFQAFEGLSITSVVIPASVTHIQDDVFKNCNALDAVYYGGLNAAQWAAINMGSNVLLTNATRYYFSATQPTTSGNFWRFVGSTPTAW